MRVNERKCEWSVFMGYTLENVDVAKAAKADLVEYAYVCAETGISFPFP